MRVRPVPGRSGRVPGRTRPVTWNRRSPPFHQSCRTPTASAATVAFGAPQLWGSREWGETDPRLIALLERQLARIGDRDPARRVRVLATLTMELYSDETAIRGWGYANEALDIARRLGQPEELGIAVSAYLFSAGELTDHVPQLRAVLDEMLQGSQDLTPQVQAI